MTDVLGVVIMEESDGRFGIQLFADPAKAKEIFEQLRGKLGDKPSRATFVSLDWAGKKVEVLARDLPLPPDDPAKRPDAWRLGEGPIKFPASLGFQESSGNIEAQHK